MDAHNVSMDYIGGGFDTLVEHIQSVGDVLRQDAYVVINRNITSRAWLTGYYIVEYEQHGRDRAKYGENLIHNLSRSLGGKSYSATNLRSYRLFYLLYPELRPIVAKYLYEHFGQYSGNAGRNQDALVSIQQSLIAELQNFEKQQSATAELRAQNDQLSVRGTSPDPVGWLLCTEYGQEMVEYLAPFTDPQLFVARYELQLPSKEKIRDFLMRENVKSK